MKRLNHYHVHFQPNPGTHYSVWNLNVQQAIAHARRVFRGLAVVRKNQRPQVHKVVRIFLDGSQREIQIPNKTHAPAA